jgi:hypothetical protein
MARDLEMAGARLDRRDEASEAALAARAALDAALYCGAGP